MKNENFEIASYLINILYENGLSIGKYYQNLAFSCCSTIIKAIEIPTSVKHININAFHNCINLEKVIFDEPSSLTEINYGAFSLCSKLKEIKIPDSITFIGENSFYKCSSLEKIQIPPSVYMIGANAFNSCLKLSYVYVNYGCIKIGQGAFAECPNLKSLRLPNSHSLLQNIQNIIEKEKSSIITLYKK